MTSIRTCTYNIEDHQSLDAQHYDEDFALKLEQEDIEAWKTIFNEISPNYGDPIADQIANILRARSEGKEVGKLIRKMLFDKANPNLIQVPTPRPESDTIDESNTSPELDTPDTESTPVKSYTELDLESDDDDFWSDKNLNEWWEQQKIRCLSMLSLATIDRLNQMDEEERNEELNWLTEELLANGPLEPIPPVYVPPTNKVKKE
jgi:hypothetical protein